MKGKQIGFNFRKFGSSAPILAGICRVDLKLGRQAFLKLLYASSMMKKVLIIIHSKNRGWHFLYSLLIISRILHFTTVTVTNTAQISNIYLLLTEFKGA